MQFVLPPPPKVQDPVDQCAYIEMAATDVRTGSWSSYWWPVADATHKEDQAISRQMSKSWVTFAKTGNPNVSDLPAWPNYSLKEDVIHEFSDNKTTLMRGLQKERVDYQIQSLQNSTNSINSIFDRQYLQLRILLSSCQLNLLT